MTDRSALHRWLATALTLLGLAGATALLVAAGRTLPFPTDLRPGRVVGWIDQAGGPTAAFTLLRGLAALLVAWCGASWSLGVLARMARLPRAVRAADRVSFPVVRRLADAAAGLAVLGATLSPVAVAAAPAPTVPEVSVVTMTDIGPAPVGSTTTSTLPDVTTTTSGPPAPSGTSSPARTAAPEPGPVVPETADAPLASGSAGVDPRASDARSGSAWVIAPGDTLWHVAEMSLAAELGHAPSPGEVVDRLDEIVAVNRDRLALPDDPDLVFPGQVFLVP